MNKLYKNSALYLVATLSIRGASFLLVPFYSYLVSPSEYGYVYIVISLVFFMSLFVTCSLHGAINRFFWECNSLKDIQIMYSTITFMVVCTSVVISSLMLSFSKEIAIWLNLPVVYLRIAVFSSVLQCFYQLITALLYVKQEAKKISMISIGVGITQILIQLIMVITMADKAMAMILSQLVCASLMFLLFLIYSRPYLRFSFDTNKVWVYFKYSICQVPSDVSVWLLSFSDRMMMNKMKGSSLTGIYGMGQTLGSIPKIIYLSMNKAYVPFVFGCYKQIDKGDENKRIELKKHTTFIFSIITVIVTLITIYSNNIVALLDKRYVQASVVMAVMLFAMLVDCYRTLFMNPLAYNVRYIKVASFIWSLTAVVNILLNYFLIPLYSIYGACFAMILSYSLTFLLIVFFARKAYYVEYEDKLMLKIFVTSMCASVILFFGPSWQILPLKVVFTVVYLWFLTKLLRIDTRKIAYKIRLSIKGKINR